MVTECDSTRSSLQILLSRKLSDIATRERELTKRYLMARDVRRAAQCRAASAKLQGRDPFPVGDVFEVPAPNDLVGITDLVDWTEEEEGGAGGPGASVNSSDMDTEAKGGDGSGRSSGRSPHRRRSNNGSSSSSGSSSRRGWAGSSGGGGMSSGGAFGNGAGGDNHTNGILAAGGFREEAQRAEAMLRGDDGDPNSTAFSTCGTVKITRSKAPPILDPETRRPAQPRSYGPLSTTVAVRPRLLKQASFPDTLPRGVAGICLTGNYGKEDDVVLRYVPYFGEDDVTGFDVSAYDLVPGEQLRKVTSEVDEALLYLLVTRFFDPPTGDDAGDPASDQEDEEDEEKERERAKGGAKKKSKKKRKTGDGEGDGEGRKKGKGKGTGGDGVAASEKEEEEEDEAGESEKEDAGSAKEDMDVEENEEGDKVPAAFKGPRSTINKPPPKAKPAAKVSNGDAWLMNMRPDDPKKAAEDEEDKPPEPKVKETKLERYVRRFWDTLARLLKYVGEGGGEGGEEGGGRVDSDICTQALSSMSLFASSYLSWPLFERFPPTLPRTRYPTSSLTKCHKDAQSTIDLHRFYSQEEVRREMEDIASPMHRDGAWRVPLWTVPTNSPVENRFHVPKGTFFTRHAGTKHLERPLEDLKDGGLLTDGLRDTPRCVSRCACVVCCTHRLLRRLFSVCSLPTPRYAARPFIPLSSNIAFSNIERSNNLRNTCVFSLFSKGTPSSSSRSVCSFAAGAGAMTAEPMGRASRCTASGGIRSSIRRSGKAKGRRLGRGAALRLPVAQTATVTFCKARSKTRRRRGVRWEAARAAARAARAAAARAAARVVARGGVKRAVVGVRRRLLPHRRRDVIRCGFLRRVLKGRTGDRLRPAVPWRVVCWWCAAATRAKRRS
jgi:hypothetical protein